MPRTRATRACHARSPPARPYSTGHSSARDGGSARCAQSRADREGAHAGEHSALQSPSASRRAQQVQSAHRRAAHDGAPWEVEQRMDAAKQTHRKSTPVRDSHDERSRRLAVGPARGSPKSTLRARRRASFLRCSSKSERDTGGVGRRSAKGRVALPELRGVLYPTEANSDHPPIRA